MRTVATGLLFALCSVQLSGQAPPLQVAIRGSMIVEGVGTPASGPKDILIQGGRIASIVPSGAALPFQADVEIDGRGRYVLPGFINLHGHIQDERAGRPMPLDYCLKLWLASGVTTVREAGNR